MYGLSEKKLHQVSKSGWKGNKTMNTFRRAVAEFVGTCVLVVVGCGTAMTVGCSGTGYLLTALAFGLGLLTMAYSIGNISGCHINPALSFALLILGKMSYKDFFAYILAQNLGALAGSGILSLIFKMGNLTDRTGVYGANGLAALEGDIAAGLIVELVLTFIFVTAVLGVSDREDRTDLSGLISALSLSGVHILGIGLTGTSVNPARSLGPALMSLFVNGNTRPLANLWIFIVAPLAGASLAALVYNWLKGRTGLEED